jgi:predicted nucleic-acid-binding Zn-ribbon protein
MGLSDLQRKQLGDYLLSHAKSCSKCGRTDWEFGNIQLPAAEIDFGNKKVEPSRLFVDITCRSCGSSEAIDCVDADISEL